MRGRRAGVSETLSVLALVVAAIAVGVIITLFAAPFTRMAASREGLSIAAASLKIISGSYAVLVVGLTNVGDSELAVSGIAITGSGSPSCTTASLPRIPPGQYVEVRLDCSNISRGATYVVSVSAQSTAGRTLIWSAKVRAQ